MCINSDEAKDLILSGNMSNGLRYVSYAIAKNLPIPSEWRMVAEDTVLRCTDLHTHIFYYRVATILLKTYQTPLGDNGY